MMNDNASIIVTLCSHLCADNCRPLEPSEWTRLADKMIEKSLQPKDILDLSDHDMKQYFGYHEEEIDRIKKLLTRAGSLSFELEKLNSMGIKVITRADKGYPQILKIKLKGSCPPMFYYAGDLSLLERRTVGFVGSRTVGDEDTSFTEEMVNKINRHGFGVVSGGAKGIDSISSAASIANGSFCIEYISDSLTRKIKKKEIISNIQNGKLLIMSMAKPDAGFNAGIAMQRNKYIYAQSEATIVVKSDYNKGGTWGGATEALRKEYCPVLCHDHRQYPGNVGLIKLGAVPIDSSWNGDIDNISSLMPDVGEQISFFDE
ncbi:MAG: DNA-processing protein DprA [Oscillospiraceae bacterium]